MDQVTIVCCICEAPREAPGPTCDDEACKKAFEKVSEEFEKYKELLDYKNGKR